MQFLGQLAHSLSQIELGAGFARQLLARVRKRLCAERGLELLVYSLGSLGCGL